MKKIIIIITCICVLFSPLIRAQAYSNVENIEINANIQTQHTTLSHTKEEVIEKYLASLQTFDYTESFYQKNPTLTSPYGEGSLKEEVKQDVLRQYNFYRWLSGLNEVTINEDKMARSQKGALINAVNNELTHYPKQPVGMNDEFYKEAYSGTGAGSGIGDTYSGNVSFGALPYEVVKGYVDDSDNVENNVGHRSSMLDPYAKQISFGNVEKFGAFSVYYDDNNLNQDTFYPWPSAGYVPTEAFPATDHTMRSIWLGDYKTTKNTKVILEYLGETYEPDELFTSRETLYYYVPDRLNEKIIRSNHQYVVDIPITVTISGLSDNTIISYQTTFVQAKEVPLEQIEFLIQVDGNRYSNIRNFKLGQTYHYLVYLMPNDATIGKLEWIVDETALSVDKKNETITPIKAGTTTLTVKDSDTGYERTFTFTIDASSTGVSLNKTILKLSPNSTSTLIATLLPIETADQVTYTWTSSDSSIATVDNGFVKALKEGTSTITVTTSNGFTATCEVEVRGYELGDVNMDGKVKMNDVILVLRESLGIGKLTEEQFKLADMNGDAKIKMNDVIMALRKSLEIL